MRGVISIKTPNNPNELLDVLRTKGYEPTREQLEEILRLLRKDEKAQAELHRLNRSESRKKTKSKAERAHRTHQLCNIGGAVVSFYPELAELMPDELYNLFDKIFNYDFTIGQIIDLAIAHRKNRNGGGASG